MHKVLLQADSTVLPCTPMDLSKFIKDTMRRDALADALGTSPAYLRQLATGFRRASPEMAKAIEVQTKRIGPEMVPRASMRPDLWGAAA